MRIERPAPKVTRANRDCSVASRAVNLSRVASHSPFKVKDTTTGRSGDRTLRKLIPFGGGSTTDRTNGLTRAGFGRQSGRQPGTVNVVADAIRRA